MDLRKISFSTLLASLLMVSCHQESIDEKEIQPKGKLLPSTIDYNEHIGSLSHLIYRANFKYNASHQLESVTDSLITSPVPASGNALPWVNFYYRDGRLTEIVLRSSDTHGEHYDPRTDPKSSRFYLTYENDLVRTIHMTGEQQKGVFDFKTDENGFPVKKNVQYGSTFLGATGNIDYVAENKAEKARNPLGSREILELTYDPNQNIFSNSKEFQILGVLLAAYHVNMITSFVPYLSILSSNNELSRTYRYCSITEGCRDAVTDLSETLSVNAQALPTRRLTQVGAMGRYQFIIQYRKN